MISIELHSDHFSDINHLDFDKNEIRVIESAGFDGGRIVRFVIDNSKSILEKVKRLIDVISEKDTITGIIITKDRVEIARASVQNLKDINAFIASIQKGL